MPGDDNDEYFELSGDAGESLEGLSYIVVGDHSGENPTKGSGTIEFALNLQGSIPQSGLFLGVEFSFTLAPELVTEEFFDLFFENSDNVTHLLVRDYTGPEVFSVADQEGEAGVDIDTDDDGVPDLDPLPWSSVVDVLGVVEEREGGERFYGEMLGGVDIGPSGPFAPAHVFRNGSNNNWLIGAFAIDDPNAQDTPGAENPSPELIITEQPVDQTITNGQSGLLMVMAEGIGSLTYDWFQGESGDSSNPVADANIPTVSNVTSDVTFFNGNDALALTKDSTIIDVIGVIGSDPGSEWGTGDITTGEHTLRRVSTVKMGDTNGFDNPGDISDQWEGFPQDTLGGLGAHSLDNGDTAADLLFSEYVEGSSSNKSIEIFNGTGAEVELTAYNVDLYFNGSSEVGNTLNLSVAQATLAAGGTLVISNAGADASDEFFNTPALTQTTNYWVRVSDDSQSIDSDTATVTVEGGDPFAGIDLGGGFFFSEWYGIYNPVFFPWVFHVQHGFQYIFPVTEGEAFFYDLESNDFWWSLSTFGVFTFYSFDRQTFNFYFVDSSNPRNFVDLETEEFWNIPSS